MYNPLYSGWRIFCLMIGIFFCCLKAIGQEKVTIETYIDSQLSNTGIGKIDKQSGRFKENWNEVQDFFSLPLIEQIKGLSEKVDTFTNSPEFWLHLKSRGIDASSGNNFIELYRKASPKIDSVYNLLTYKFPRYYSDFHILHSRISPGLGNSKQKIIVNKLDSLNNLFEKQLRVSKKIIKREFPRYFLLFFSKDENIEIAGKVTEEYFRFINILEISNKNLEDSSQILKNKLDAIKYKFLEDSLEIDNDYRIYNNRVTRLVGTLDQELKSWKLKHDSTEKALDNLRLNFYSEKASLIQENKALLKSVKKSQNIVDSLENCREEQVYELNSILKKYNYLVNAHGKQDELIRQLDESIRNREQLTIEMKIFNRALIILSIVLCIAIIWLLRIKKKLSKTEKKLRLALYELPHRVKNNLQNISSFIQLQERRTSDEETKFIFQKTLSYIESFKIVHKHLYQKTQKNLTYINLRDFLFELLRYHDQLNKLHNHKVEAITDIQEIHAYVEDVNIIGTIVNELIANSYKHAPTHNQILKLFLSVKKCKNNILINIKDNGPGLPNNTLEINSRSSFGLYYLTRMIKLMKGKFQYRYEDGANFNISFPVSNKLYS